MIPQTEIQTEVFLECNMRTGRIQYNLFGIKAFPMSKKFACAESFDELNQKQLQWWATNVWPNLSKMISVKEDEDGNQIQLINDPVEFFTLNMAICKIISNIPSWLYLMLDDEALRNMVYTWKLPQFMYTTTYAPNKNPIVKIGKLYGPKSTDDLIGWEFTFTDAMYLKYRQTKDLKFLDKFVSQIYRPRKVVMQGLPDAPYFDLDERQYYHHQTDIYRIADIAAAPIDVKMLVLYWYEYWRGNLPKQFPFLFTKKNDSSAEAAGSWLPTFLHASNGIHNFEAIKKTKVMLLLTELNRLMKQQKDMEKRMDEFKNRHN